MDNGMRLVRMKTAYSGPMEPKGEGIASVTMKSAKRLIDSGQAEPLCGTDREQAIVMLVTAAEMLDVTLTTRDKAIDEAATKYGARCTLHKGK